MRHELSYARFFEPKQRSPSVDDALRQCVSRRSALRVHLGSSSVSLLVDESEPAEKTLSLTGRWRSPLLEGHQLKAGALVMAPLVFLIEQLCLPHGSLFTLGRADRSVADFCMRNVFYAACRSEPIRFHRAEAAITEASAKGSRDLARTYLWIAKAYLKDKVFDRANAPELVLACAHLPLLEFGSALVESGAGELRRTSARLAAAHRTHEHQRAFRHVRESVLALYRT